MPSPLHFSPAKGTLVLLFELAKRRVAEHTDGVDKLSEAGILAATEELNRIADDIREALATFESSLSTGSSTKIKSQGTVATPRDRANALIKEAVDAREARRVGAAGD